MIVTRNNEKSSIFIFSVMNNEIYRILKVIVNVYFSFWIIYVLKNNRNKEEALWKKFLQVHPDMYKEKMY